MKHKVGKQPHILFLLVLLAALFLGIPIAKNGVFGLIHFDNLSLMYAGLVYTFWYFYRKNSVCDIIAQRYLISIYVFIMVLNVNTILKYGTFRHNLTAVR